MADHHNHKDIVTLVLADEKVKSRYQRASPNDEDLIDDDFGT